MALPISNGVKKLVLFLVSMLLLGGCSLVTEKLPQIALANKGNNFDFPVGQQFEVVLPSNQSTGYQWQVDDITAGALEQVNNEYRLSDKYKEDIIGAGGEEIWTFKVLKIERSHIVMKYRRPWDKLDVANDFLVTINGNPGDDGLLTYVGVIKSTPAGSQFDDYFTSDTGEEFGIEPLEQNQIADPGVKAKLSEVKDKEIKVEIRGKFSADTADYKDQKFIIHEIQAK